MMLRRREHWLFVATHVDAYRERTFSLLSHAYSSISIADTSAYLGLPEDQTSACMSKLLATTSPPSARCT